MKKIVLFFIFFIILLPSGLLLPVEVSEKQDIAIFGMTYSTYNIPDEVLGFADSSIKYVFIKLKRFNVLGYGQYRIESDDIDDFIKRIREIRSEKAKEVGTYDEKFGTVVIKGEDFDKIVNSFLVVIPSLSNYNVSREKTEYTSGTTTYVVDSYTIDVVIDITFVDAREGTQEESLRVTGSGEDDNIGRASRKAVENAISGLSYNIKQIEAFKIKSGVIRVRGDTVFFELGKNLGVKPGDEYEIMTKQEIGKTGRIVELPTGLVRVKKVYPEISEARIVYQKGRITQGDQLVEVPRFGLQFSPYAGFMKVDIPDMNYDIILGDDLDFPPFTSYYYISLDQKERNYSPLAGIHVVKNLGYRYRGVLDATVLLNFPLIGGIGELGIGASLYKKRLSVDLLYAVGLLYMTTFSQDLEQNGILDTITIDGTKIEFKNDPVLNIYGVAGGVKGGIGFNLRIKPNSALRAAVNYRLYTPIKNWRLHIEETSGNNKQSVTIGNDNDNIDVQAGGLKRVRISGYEVNLAFTLQF